MLNPLLLNSAALKIKWDSLQDIADYFQDFFSMVRDKSEWFFDSFNDFVFSVSNIITGIPTFFQSVYGFFTNIGTYLSELWSNLNFTLDYVGILRQMFSLLILYLPAFLGLSATIFFGVQIVKLIFGRN